MFVLAWSTTRWLSLALVLLSLLLSTREREAIKVEESGGRKEIP